MADAKRALIAYWSAHTAVAAMFGTRIYPDHIPDVPKPEYPYVCLTLVSDPRKYSMDKKALGRKVRVQADIYSDAAVAIEAAVDTLESSISGYQGMLGEVMEAGYVFVKKVDGGWNTEARNRHRILELEIGTNV